MTDIVLLKNVISIETKYYKNWKIKNVIIVDVVKICPSLRPFNSWIAENSPMSSIKRPE
jgi:hypothetical protein